MICQKMQNPVNQLDYRILISYGFLKSDLAGARTQDPLLKREMLYQLSYQVKISVPSCLAKRVQI